MELEIREIPSAEEKSRQNNHLASFKAELKRLQLEYNSTRRRVQRKTLLNNHSEEDSNYLEVGIFKNKFVKLISLKNYHPISLCVVYYVQKIREINFTEKLSSNFIIFSLKLQIQYSSTIEYFF